MHMPAQHEMEVIDACAPQRLAERCCTTRRPSGPVNRARASAVHRTLEIAESHLSTTLEKGAVATLENGATGSSVPSLPCLGF